ncbi:MAG: dethiobiotin synthase [Bacteroidetes bacterium MedPE-SWsnd-G2]|nr:MAG: dethiobiotin synthase [Bacteroidetes bacterium MedPE-SWsnd-G2]
MTSIFVTGISTDVGKTVASAIIVEALNSDYWKPIQAGDLDFGDQQRVEQLISNQSSTFYPNAYGLKTPMSPHAAAAIDGIQIESKSIIRPQSSNHLVIEGAGGLLVPISDTETILDLVLPEDKIIVVSRHYLGSINHSLLTLKLLNEKGFKPGVIFSGEEHPTTESIIENMSDCTIIGRIDQEPYFDTDVISDYAESFKTNLNTFVNS